MARTITQENGKTIGKYVGFNLDAFGENDEYFSTSGEYQTMRSSAGVQALGASSFKREGGLSLIEMFDVGVLGMPTLTLIYDDQEFNDYNKKKLQESFGASVSSNEWFGNLGGFSYGHYSLNSYQYKDGAYAGNYYGIQSIADAFRVFDTNINNIYGLAKNNFYTTYSIKQSIGLKYNGVWDNDAPANSLHKRISTIENLIEVDDNTDTVINKFKEMQQWFAGIQEGETGAALISTVSEIKSQYIKSVNGQTPDSTKDVTLNGSHIPVYPTPLPGQNPASYFTFTTDRHGFTATTNSAKDNSYSISEFATDILHVLDQGFSFGYSRYDSLQVQLNNIGSGAANVYANTINLKADTGLIATYEFTVNTHGFSDRLTLQADSLVLDVLHRLASTMEYGFRQTHANIEAVSGGSSHSQQWLVL